MSINIQSLIKNVKKIRLHLFRFSLLYILLLQTILNAQIQDFQVNENAGPQGEDQRHPSISVDSDGNFVIAWVDDRNGDPDIYAQRYANDGRLLGNNFKVNDQGRVDRWYISISTGGNGIFTVTWADSRNGDFDIYAQRYYSDGTNIGSNFRVNDDTGLAEQGSPSVSIDSEGSFVISWDDNRNGDMDIYAQRYSNNGNTLGTNFKVNDDHDNNFQALSSICADNSGNFVITWGDYRNGDPGVYAQRYLSDGTTLGSNFQVNDDKGIAWYPSISNDNIGNFVITWTDFRNGNVDIYAQRYSSDGSVVGNNFRVDDDTGNEEQEIPSISVDISGNFVITWQDTRNGGYDIYAQRYSSNGSPLGTNFRVTNTSQENQYDPEVKLLNDRIYNTWTDHRASFNKSDIWGNVLDWNNPPNPPNPVQIVAADFLDGNFGWMAEKDMIFKTNDGGKIWNSLSLDPHRNIQLIDFIDNSVGWSIDHLGDSDTVCMISKTQDSGQSWVVQEVFTTTEQYKIQSICAVSKDMIYVAGPKIYTNGPFGYIKKTTDGGLNWDDVSPSDYNRDFRSISFINGQMGAVVGDYYSDGFVSRTFDGGDTWQETIVPNLQLNNLQYVNDSTLFFTDNNQNLYRSTDSMNSWTIRAENVRCYHALDENTVYAVKQSNISKSEDGGLSWSVQHSGYNDLIFIKFVNILTGWAVGRFGSVLKTTDGGINWIDKSLVVGIEESNTDTTNSKLRAFYLHQNYPNPFNPVTKIRYSNPKFAFVTLKVYDLMGREITILVNEKQKTGNYEVEFDAYNLSSGIYFYQLKTNDFIVTKKMILIK